MIGFEGLFGQECGFDTSGAMASRKARATAWSTRTPPTRRQRFALPLARQLAAQ